MMDAEVVSEETTFYPDLSHVEFAAHMFGWCNDGNHAPKGDDIKGCPGVRGGTPWKDPSDPRRRIPNPVKRCPCKCHTRDLRWASESKTEESQ